jgi:hypothetical protein
MYCRSSVAVRETRREEAKESEAAREQNRRGSGPLEEPAPARLAALRLGWRGLTPRWPRSLRLGSASGFKVARPFGNCNPSATKTPHVPKKTLLRSPETAHLRQRLPVLPQWMYGWRRPFSACAPGLRTVLRARNAVLPLTGAPGHNPARDPARDCAHPRQRREPIR